MKIILDMRLQQNHYTNLKSRLLLLDADGAPVGNPLIDFNEIDVGHRIVAAFATPRGVAGLKLQNGGTIADLWLTVLPANAAHFIPFFGEIVPRALKVGETTTGSLDKIDYAYYVTAFAPGSYKLILDVANRDGGNTNIQGYVAFLDEEGGKLRKVIQLNEIDTSHRSTHAFTLTRARSLIVQLFNSAYPVNYTLRVIPQ